MKKRVFGFICTVCVIIMQFSCMVIPASARTDFKPAWPLRNGFNIIALDYYQGGGSHSGIDTGHGNKPTQAVYAVAAGTVYEIGNKCNHYNAYKTDEKGNTKQTHKDVARECGADDKGNYVIIKHKVGSKVFYSRYLHLTKDSINVKEGDPVTGDTVIGKMGSTGNSMGPHLHFAIYEGGETQEKYTKEKGSKTFDFYKDNPDIMKKLAISEKLAKTSKNYGAWIKENGTLKTFSKETKRYVFTDIGNKPKNNVPSTLAINLTSYPTNITKGKTFSLRGDVTSNYNITSVKGYIIDASTNKILQTTEDNPNAKSMDIRPAKLNQSLLFDKLPVGSYYLKVEATDTYSTKPVPWTGAFTVKADQQNTSSTNTATEKPVSTLAINLTDYPTSITKGKTFSLRGDVTSNYNITSVKGYIIDASTNKILQTTEDKPNAKSMDIRPADLNQSMLFDKLSAGSYYLRIESTDASGKTLVSSKSFTVKSGNSSASSSGNSAAAPKMVYPNPGWYALTPACAPGMRLDVAYSGASSEDPVWIWGANGSAAQSWYLLPYSQSVGHYLLVAGTNLDVKMVLDVQYGGTESGTPVWLYESNGTPAQEWIFLDAGDGYFYVVPSENQDLALAVKGGSSNEGSSLVVETRNGSAGQKWTLIN